MPEHGVESSKEVLRERLQNEQKRAQDLKAQYYLEVKAAEKQPDLALREISEQPRAAQIIRELQGLVGNDIPLTRDLNELAAWAGKPLDKPENMEGGSIRQLLLELQSGSSESSSEAAADALKFSQDRARQLIGLFTTAVAKNEQDTSRGLELRDMLGELIGPENLPPYPASMQDVYRWQEIDLNNPNSVKGGSLEQKLNAVKSAEAGSSVERSKAAFQAMIVDAFAQGGKLKLTKEEMLSALQEMGLLPGTPVRKDRGPLNALGTPEQQRERNRSLNE